VGGQGDRVPFSELGSIHYRHGNAVAEQAMVIANI